MVGRAQIRVDQPDRALVAHHRRGDECGRTGKEAERARVAGVGDQDRSLAPQHLRLVQSRTERRRIRRDLRERLQLLRLGVARKRALEGQLAAADAEHGGAVEAEVLAQRLRGLPEERVQRAERPQAPQGAAHSGVGKRVHGSISSSPVSSTFGSPDRIRPSRFSRASFWTSATTRASEPADSLVRAMSDSESPSFTT